MSRSEQAFLLLLRSGLWENDIADLSLFPLSEEEWAEVLQMSERQTVQGLLYRGFQHLPEHLFPPQSLVWRWVAIASRLEKEYRQCATCVAATFSQLEAAGVQPVLQKGLAVARYYEHPELRVNGDIDWWVDSSKMKGLDVKIDHPFQEDIEVDLHNQLFDLERPRHKRAVRQLQAQIEEMTVLSATRVRVPTPMPTLVMLNAHVMKHTFTVGVGLRQFCDMARAYHRLYGQYDADVLSDTYHQTGLWRWSELLHLFLIEYLGMSAHELPMPAPTQPRDCQRLFRQVLRDGNFGHYTTHWQGAHANGRNRWHTVRQIICRLPFSLRYAPTEMLFKVVTLSRMTKTKRKTKTKANNEDDNE